MQAKRWIITQCDNKEKDMMSKALGVSPYIAEILLKRGITNITDAQEFLNPALHNLSKPLEMLNMGAAAEQIWRNIEQKKKIIVYGDYRGIERDNEQIFAYERELGAEKLLVVCNFTDNEPEFTVPEDFDLDSAVCLIANTNRNEYVRKMQLKPYEAFVLSQK